MSAPDSEDIHVELPSGGLARVTQEGAQNPELLMALDEMMQRAKEHFTARGLPPESQGEALVVQWEGIAALTPQPAEPCAQGGKDARIAELEAERDELRLCVKRLCSAAGFSYPHNGPGEYLQEIEERADALRRNLAYHRREHEEATAQLSEVTRERDALSGATLLWEVASRKTNERLAGSEADRERLRAALEERARE